MTMTREQSAVVRYLHLSTKATQRLNAENLLISNLKEEPPLKRNNKLKAAPSAATRPLGGHNKIYAYLVGFIEGDGWITVNKKGKYLTYELGIELHIKDIQLLYKIKKLLGIGIVKIKKIKLKNNEIKESAIFIIRNKNHLKDIIIPILDKYPMLTNKHYDYLNLKNNLLKNIIYWDDYNKYTRPINIYLDDNDKPISRILKIYYFKYWLIGFIEAEGCFSIYKPINDKSKIASFEISQTNDYFIIEAIKQYLNITSNVYKNKNESYRIKTTSIRNIENVIKFINNNPIKLMGKKRLQYLLFLKELRTIPRYANKINIPNKYATNKI